MERVCQERVCELLLLLPTAGLVEQIGQYIQLHHEWGLTVCNSILPGNQRGALAQADIAIADATEDPASAVRAFEIAVAVLGPKHVSTYTEVMHTGLELFVRTRGGLLLLGPMSVTEWNGYFQSAMRSRARAAGISERSADVGMRRPGAAVGTAGLSGHGRPADICVDREVSR